MNTTYMTDVLTLLCDVCRKPVTVGHGYTCVDDGTARERIREAQEFEAPSLWTRAWRRLCGSTCATACCRCQI